MFMNVTLVSVIYHLCYSNKMTRFRITQWEISEIIKQNSYKNHSFHIWNINRFEKKIDASQSY